MTTTVQSERDDASANRKNAPDHGRSASLYTLALREELRSGLDTLGDLAIGPYRIEIARGGDSIWALIRRPGRGGLAVRAAFAPGGFTALRRNDAGDRDFTLECESALGRHRLCFDASGADLHRFRLRAWLTPEAPLLVPFSPRDLYPLDNADDPLGAAGRVEAAQRGPNAGLIYFAVDEPAFGHVLYFQDLTQLNGYFRATDTVPDGVVGGEWPELGYLMPSPPQSGTPPIHPLPAGEETMLSDAVIVLREQTASGEQQKAQQFIQMLGIAYQAIELPPVEYRDWVDRSKRTLRDLDRAPEATWRSYGHRYIRPYTDAEVPDSMVQMTVIASLHDYARWTGEPIPLLDELVAGMEKFYDPRRKMLRRYLPNVGNGKNPNAVDSWYLLHPLRNLARLALAGEKWAERLLLRSIDFAIRSAHHFDYLWPIEYDRRDLSVLTATRGDDEHGQTDVGGFYAYLMLQLFELTDEARFLNEARAAIDAAAGMRFELEYQANLTAWGAAACLRLWRITKEDRYRDQSYVYLASFFHNCQIWESKIGAAANYSNFLGATVLHDASYMAMYECFDSFAAFEQYVRDSGPEVEPAARMLVGEYCKYVLHRAWFYYPDALPAEILASECRNGFIARDLSFPLEDLYADGSQAGQVGQEIYGGGGAFVLASRAFHPIEGAPFRLFCNHFLLSRERTGEQALSLQLTGGETCRALLAMVRTGRAALPAFKLVTIDGDQLRPSLESDDRVEFSLPADAHVVLRWD